MVKYLVNMARPLCRANRVRVATNLYATARNSDDYWLLDATLRSGAAFPCAHC
jgi:hypothetical protein